MALLVKINVLWGWCKVMKCFYCLLCFLAILTGCDNTRSDAVADDIIDDTTAIIAINTTGADVDKITDLFADLDNNIADSIADAHVDLIADADIDKTAGVIAHAIIYTMADSIADSLADFDADNTTNVIARIYVGINGMGDVIANTINNIDLIANVNNGIYENAGIIADVIVDAMSERLADFDINDAIEVIANSGFLIDDGILANSRLHDSVIAEIIAINDMLLRMATHYMICLILIVN